MAEPKPWPVRAARLLGKSESAVLVLIGMSLVVVALLLLFASMHDLTAAVRQGSEQIETQAIDILNVILLVMMTMEIVYTVAVSLESHRLRAEPFLIIGIIAGIRRMLVITATSTKHEEANPVLFHNMLIELGLIAATVVALALAIWILRYSSFHFDKPAESESE
jgi:phosphate starvation-inducible membrane PsiE